MLDPETFLVELYVLVDEVCKQQLPPVVQPGPAAALHRSEVLTLALFAQWARFRSERDFWRYATQRLRPLFPRLPHRTQFNRQLRRHRDALAVVALALGATGAPRPTKRSTAPRCRRATPSDAGGAGCQGWPISGGATAGGGTRASIYSSPPLPAER
jgi:hypothetical protein